MTKRRTAKKPVEKSGKGPRSENVYTLEQALALAIDLHQKEHLQDAAIIYQKILSYQPQHADALNFYGVLCHQQGHSEAAIDSIKQAIALQPGHAPMYNNLGNVLQQVGRLDEASSAYHEGLESDPDNPDICNNLGQIYKRQERFDEALKYSLKAIELNANRAEFYLNLGHIQRRRKSYQDARNSLQKAIDCKAAYGEAFAELGHVFASLGLREAADEAYQKALAHNSDKAASYYAIAQNFREMRRFEDAIAAYEKALALRRVFDNAYFGLGTAHYSLGNNDRATDVWRRWLDVNPSNSWCRHMLAAGSGENVPDRAGDEYVRNLFDSFADHFDENLENLKYQVPQLLADELALLSSAPNRQFDILDAGCGTGLCGPLLKPFAKRLIGVDLSPSMLEKAKLRGGYDELIEAELGAFLASREAEYDVIVSADTLEYFGDLRAVLDGAAQALLAGGWLLFSVEKAASDIPDGYRINPHGRYSHSEVYLRQMLATRFASMKIVTAVLRLEKGQPVEGYLVIAQR
ncbi:MAG: tetratricopeptide repeat protein [Variovorax sp.]